jgi:hypothetical protein
VIESQDCSSCLGNKYLYNNSTNYLGDPKNRMQIKYGSALIEGISFQDKIYMDRSRKFGLQAFQMMLVKDQ